MSSKKKNVIAMTKNYEDRHTLEHFGKYQEFQNAEVICFSQGTSVTI